MENKSFVMQRGMLSVANAAGGQASWREKGGPLRLWVAKMALPPPPSCVLLPLDGCVALCSTITLALLLFLTKRSPGGLLAWDKALPQAWKRTVPLSTESEAPGGPPSRGWPVHDLESRGPSCKAVLGQENGTAGWEEEAQFRQSPWTGSGHSATIIRKLLCDNASCVLCAHAAREAEKMVHVHRLNTENIVLRKPSLPTTSYVERSSLPAISGLQDNPLFSRSRSEPPEVGHLGHRPAALPLLRKRRRLPRDVPQRKKHLLSHLPGTDPFPKHASHLRHPHLQVSCQGKNDFHTIDEQKDEEDESSSSSSTSGPSYTNRAGYGHFSGVSTVYSQKDHTLWAHQKTFHYHEDDGSSSEQDVSSNTEGEDQRSTHLLSEEEQDFLTASLTSAASSISRKMVFVAIDLPFVSEAVLEKLEQHLVVKRMQNAIGLPRILLRSLKAFLPFSPSPIIRWPPKREVVVVTRPQVLPFKSVATRRRLEQHVKKRAQLKHWGLPRKIQEVLRHMKMDFPPTVPGEERSGGEKSPSSMKRPHLVSTTREKTLDDFLRSKPRFQVHIGKKLFQIAQEALPKRVEKSQKMSASVEKKIVLPKRIRVPWRSPQARGGPSLGLRRKADSVEMNIKCKHIQLLWQLPTFYSQSLSKMAPEPFHLPVTPVLLFRPSEFGHAETPFLPSSQRQLLDSHVLRKKVQHQWGQPKLVQQSLRQFLSAAPPLTPFSPATPKGPQVDVKVAPRNMLPFVPLEANRKLDDHIKRKIIERQWGVPQRVMKSLQMFMPMPPSVAKMARESEEEEVEKRSPSVKDSALHKLPQVLQKHMAQKALEIHLGEAGPFPMLLQTAAIQGREDVLPRVISPGSRTLQLRPKELHFMEMTALECIELSVRHKDLAHQWGLLTLYQKSLSHLFRGVEFQVPPPPSCRRVLGLDISSSDTVFISQATREDLEWHVRRKKMQHTWGLANLIKKSLQLFLPAAPGWHAAGHSEVTTLPAEISFLGDVVIHELERNMRKRVVLQRWHLPRRLLEPAKMLGSEMAAASGPSKEMKKPGRIPVSSPGQPEVFHLLPQGKALKEMKICLEKKHMETLLGVMPTVARSSWQHATFTPRQPLPKPIPPGHNFLQPRCCFLPFERPEDVVQIEQTLKHKWLMFLWGLTTQYLEALGGMMMPKPPRQPLQPRWADHLVFSEMKALFLQEDVREAFEGHVRRKWLQHQWGLPDVIRRSLRGFIEGAPSQLPQQSVTEVQVLHMKLAFLPQDSSRFLELHIHRRKHQHQWGLPKRVLEAMKGLGAESITGPQPKEMQEMDQSQVSLGASEAMATNGQEAPRPPSPGELSPPETLFFRSEAEKRIQILFLKKCVEVHTGVFPGVARQSWQRLPPSRAPLPKPAFPSSWTPQPRRHFLPFLQAEDTDRLELAILRHRLTFLWGLGRVYMGGIAALQPKLSSSHRRPREASEEQTLSLQAEVREALELHVRKKRLEHGWGVPRLIQKSLQGFMERAPSQPSLQKMDSYARILCQGPDFLPPSTCAHLESHIQRRYLQRQWRLPAKSLESLKLLYPRLELSPSELRSREDGDIFPYCCGQGELSEHPTLDLGYFQPEGDMGTDDSVEGTTQQAEVLSKIYSKDVNQLQIYLGKKNVEVQLEAIPNVADLAWTQSSSRQRLPKQIPPGLRIWQPRSSSLSFFRAEEMERIEMTIRCNHLISFWNLGMRYTDVLSALPFMPFSKPFGLRRTSIEFSEVQTSFLQEEERQGLENHIARKKIHHTWGFPILVQKSVKAFMQELPVPLTPQKNLIDVHVVHQEPSFLPQVVSSHLEFHVKKMNFQQQWGLPRRTLKSLWMLCPTREEPEAQRPPTSPLDQSWRNFRRGPSWEMASEGWPGGAQSTERDLRTKSDVLHTLDPPNLMRLELHLAKKHMEIHHRVLPTTAKASLQLADLYSKQPLPKPILSGQGLLRPRNFSPLTVSAEDRDHLEWVIQKNHFAFLWGMGLRYREALAGMMPRFTSLFPRQRLAQADFSEVQMFFLQTEDREVLEDHIKKKRLQHMWSCPILVQRSVEHFMSRAPLCPSTHKLETNIRILLYEVHFLSTNTQTHLEHHIQRRKLLQKWGLPKQIHKSLKIFLPRASMEAPVPPNEEPLEGPKNQKWKQPPSESLSEVSSPVPSPRATKQQTFHFQAVETPYLQDKEKEVLEHHIKKKRLQHQWGLPVVIQRSLQAFSPSPLGPLRHPKKAGQDTKIQVQRPLFLHLHSQENLEDSLKRMITHQQWRLPKKVHDALRALSSAAPVRRPQPDQKRAGPDHVAKKDHLKKHLRRKSAEISFQSRTVPDILLPESLYSERGPISTTQPPRATSAINDEGPSQRTSQAEAKDLLEFHILHKKICHEWGLPRIVQKSLSAFCPPLPKPRADQGSVGERLETVEEDLQDDEMKLLAESQQVTKEEVSETPQDSKRDSASAEAIEMEKLTLTGGMPESSEEIISTGGKSQENKEESHPGNGSVAFETPQAAEERGAVETTLRGDAAAENGRYFPGTSPLQMEEEGIHGAAEEEDSTDHGLQAGPKDVALDRLHATEESTEELCINNPQSAEETSITSKGSQAIEGMVELQSTEEVVEMPQAPEEMAGARKLPEDKEDNENVMSSKSETTQSPASEYSLTVERERDMAENVVGEKAKDAAITTATEESDFPGGQHGKKSQSIKDMNLADGRRPSTAENIMAVNVEANVPDQILPTMEGGVSPLVPLEVAPSGSLIPEAIEEANTPDKAAWFIDETAIVARSSPAPVPDRSPDMNLNGQSPHAREENNLGEISSGRSPEEETSPSGESSVAASKEAITSDGPSDKEEGHTEKGPPLAGEEGACSELHLQWVIAAERSPVEGGMQDGCVSCQVTGRLSPMVESPPVAERERMNGKTQAQDTTGHPATPFGGEAPRQTQESFREFLPQSRFHSYHKSTRVHFLTEAEPDSHSRPQESPPTFRSEVRLRLEPGGTIGSWMSTKESSRSSSPNAPPILEASEEGSSQEIQGEEDKARLSTPKGRSSSRDKPELTVPHVPKQVWFTFSEPEDYGSPSPLPPQSSYDRYDPSPRESQASDTSEFISWEGNAESMPSSSIEQMLWDKESLSWQLENSMKGMVRRSASPSGRRQSGMQPVTCSPYESAATVCEREVGQNGEQQQEAFPMARDAGTRSMASPEDNEAHHVGSTVQDHLPEQENLLKPSEVATNPQLRCHVVQRALGSFILPACVISSYSTCEDVEVELIRQAGRRHRQRLSGQLVEEKPVLEKERESPPEQGYGVRGGRPSRSAAPSTGEPKDWAYRDLWEPPAPPSSPNLSITTLDKQDHEGSQVTGEASSEGSELSKLSSKKFSAASSLEAGSDLPAPPSDWLRSETGAESGDEEGSSLVIRDDPQTPHQQQSMQQNPVSLEDQSQFSTECEWDRVGDWATEDMNSESLTLEKESSHPPMEECSSEGSSLKADASSRSQGESTSSRSRLDKSKGLTIIGSILEKKLSLKQGMEFWQHSQGRRLTTWAEEKRHRVPSEEEVAAGGAGFSADTESAREGDAAERWTDPHPALQSRGGTSRVGGTQVPQRQTFLTGQPGFRHRGDTSTGSFSTRCHASGSSSEDYTQEKTWGPGGALAWDRVGLKASASTSGARKRRNPKIQGLERAAERGAGSRKWGPSRRKTRPVKRDAGPSGQGESSSSSREGRPGSGTSKREGQPVAPAQGPAKTREGRLRRRRDEPPMLERTTPQPLPQAEQDDGAWRSPQCRGDRGLLRLSPQECQAAGGEGSPLEDPPGGYGVSEATAPPGRPTHPLPHGEQFHNLRERIRSRRKELWSSPESQDEKLG